MNDNDDRSSTEKSNISIRIDLSISSLLYHIITGKISLFPPFMRRGSRGASLNFFPPEKTAGLALINYYVLLFVHPEECRIA